MMIILLVTAQVLAIAFCLFGAWRLHRRRRARVQVDENRWAEFESQFRAYAARYERRTHAQAHAPRHDSRDRHTGRPR